MRKQQFIILSRGNERYIQAYRNDDGSFLLEYRDGSAEAHFETETQAGIDDVEQAFIRYASNMDDWSAPWNWQKLDI